MLLDSAHVLVVSPGLVQLSRRSVATCRSEPTPALDGSIIIFTFLSTWVRLEHKMKISKITIQKFRSIQHTALEPRDYTVLIGPNNHGKSNILRALLFFFDEIKLTEEDFLQEEHGTQ